jgi:hypothetical protein
MWYLAAILIYSAVPPNQFTDYKARFSPSIYAVQADCLSSAAFLNARAPTSALPPDVKPYYVCVQI